ncbi:MAG: hypothetical protein CV082_05810 [Candidatus Brocadia sp. BL1]|nr:MAG: hypothetical protein CV082_05810 [Candidatus Brocadia sp. BL1]
MVTIQYVENPSRIKVAVFIIGKASARIRHTLKSPLFKGALALTSNNGVEGCVTRQQMFHLLPYIGNTLEIPLKKAKLLQETKSLIKV